MKKLEDLTADEGIELALRILLEKGFESKYYSSWQDYASYEYDEEDFENYLPSDSSGAWEALLNYVPRDKGFTSEGLTARVEATQHDGPAHDPEVYFVVFSLSDGKTTRYFKRNGWYASYDGGHLEEGENSEVFPKEIVVKDWATK